MNKYRRFKYPFGGTGYVDPSNPTPDLQSILAYQDNLPVANNTGNVQLVNEPRQYLQEYTERVRPEIERKVNEMNRRPSGNGKIIRNHDKLYDYYKDGDKLYYRKKGGKNWIDISDNDVAQKRINATIARNKKSYGNNKNEVKQKTETTPVALATPAPKVTTASTRTQNNNRVQGSGSYKSDTITDIVRNAIYGKRPQFTPSKVQPSSTSVRNAKPQGRRLNEPKTRPYTYHGGRKYNIYTDGKGNWIE